MKLFFSSRKNKLFLSLSILLIISFLLTSFTSYFITNSSLEKHIVESELPLTSDNIYSEIQKDLIQPILISSLMSTDTFLRDWLINGEKNTKEITHYLQDIQLKYHAFTSFLVSEKTKTYYHTDGIFKQIKKSDKQDTWYFRLKKKKEEYEINSDYDMAHKGELTIFVNYKVFDYNKHFIGATGIGLSVKFVQKLIDTYQQKYKRNIFFIDKKGNVQLHATKQVRGFNSIDSQQGLSVLKEKIFSRSQGSYEYRDNQNNKIYLNARYIPEIGWYLLVEQSAEENERNILNTLFMNLLICLFIITIVLKITSITVRSYQEDLEKVATTDQLTGLYNRHKINDAYEQELIRTKRFKKSFSLILLDIDFFKEINDTHGHNVGDNVLKEISTRLKLDIREADILGRWGGEEFIILCPETEREGAVNIAEKLRHAIASLPFSSIDKVTASFGVVTFRKGDNAETLLLRVDKALYQAKDAGRNCVISL